MFLPSCDQISFTGISLGKLQRHKIEKMRTQATGPTIARRGLPIWPAGARPDWKKGGNCPGSARPQFLGPHKALTALVFAMLLGKAPSHSQWEVQLCAC